MVLNNRHIALGVFVVSVTLMLMGYGQSIYSDCPQFGEQISNDSTEPPLTPTLRCIGFNLIEVLLIGGAFVGLIIGVVGLLD